MSLQPGAKVDRYRIVARLGAGGMGEVFRAHDTRLQRDIALKILHPDQNAGSGSEAPSVGAARMLREARSVAALTHPNVITIHDVGEITDPEELRGTPYIAMELIEGRSLRELIDAPAAPLEERLAWLTSAALALDAAHRVGLVHRDVKPENIMIRADGVVKVLDFGIAKRAYGSINVDPTSSTEAQLLPQHSTSGLVIGTPYYMAPEQMRSDPLDGRADQFSWGVVAYELLSGKAAWGTAGDALKLVSEVLSRELPAPSTINPEIPPYVDAVLLRTLAKSRDARFPSMADVVSALSRRATTSVRVDRASEPAAYAKTESMAPVPTSGGAGASAGVSAPPEHLSSSGSAPLPIAPASAVARGSTRVRVRVGAAIAIGALAIAGVVYRRGADRSALPSPAASVAKAPAFPDYGSPLPSVPAAAEAYRAGMSSYRDANQDRAQRDLAHAVEADPSCAAAHLRAALLSIPPSEPARTDLQEATRLRASLGAHDQALVDAFAPIASAPGDLAEANRRLTALVAQAPGDADFVFQQCRVQVALGEYTGAIATCTRASELDPGAAVPLRMRAMAQIHVEDVPGALASFEACLRASPLATWCLQPLVQLHAFGGECEAALTAAHRLVSADRTSASSYDDLADVLLGSGEPIESVRTVLADELARLPKDDARVQKARDEAFVAIATGDFAAARASIRAWEQEIATSRDEEDHFEVSQTSVALALEEGRDEDARSTATAYLDQRPAWVTSDDFDRSMFFAGVLYRTGGITREDFTQRRAHFLEAAKSHARGSRWGAVLGIAWIRAYAAPAQTAADAREALDVLPDYLPLPDPFMWAPELEQPIGRAYHLAGRDAEAIPYLTRAAKGCTGFEGRIERLWASLDLGAALEAAGQTQAACDAYRAVTRQWGGSAARSSRSARRAEARASALACAR